MLTSADLSKDEARRLVSSCFHDRAAEFDEGWLPKTSEPDLERHEQLCLSQEYVRQLEGRRSAADFNWQATSIAEESLAKRGLTLASLRPSSRADLLDGSTRALIEMQRLFQLRLFDRLAPFQPNDPLFQPNPAEHASVQALAATPPVLPTGLSLGEAVGNYLRAHENRWTKKTHVSRQTRLRFLVEHLGEGVPLSVITADHVRSFRDAVRRLRRTVGKFRASTFAARQTESSAQQVSLQTAALIFIPCQAFFRWCTHEEGYIKINPAEDLRISVPPRPKGKKTRRPFSAEELKTLFSAPLFIGTKTRSRRYEPGDVLVRDGRYWIPILGFYSGARLGELVQLHIRDLHVAGPVPYMEITEDGGGAAGTSEAKHVKSHAGVRNVPLHPDLVELGFIKFVTERSRRRSSKRLFPEIGFGADEQASTTFSKWFGRFMDKAGLIDPALVFHSFRHAAEDAFRNAGQQQYVIDRIIGHSDGATSALYGEGVSLETAYEAVKAMKLKVLLPDLWKTRKLGSTAS